MPQLLVNNQCIKLEFIRRSKIYTGSRWNTREAVISSAEFKHLDNSFEGICESYWALQVGQPQRHASWLVSEAMGVSVSSSNIQC